MVKIKRYQKYLGWILMFVLLSALRGLVACAKVDFSASSGSAQLCQSNCTTISGNRTFNYNYTTGTAAADILFVIDNSASMYPIQTQIANRFSNFLSQISGYDYHIAITNTDISTSPGNIVRSSLDGVPYVQDGGLYTFPDGSNYLTNASGGLAGSFDITVKRQETLDCQNWIAANCDVTVGCADLSALQANCPSEYTRGIVAASDAIIVNGSSTGFVRDSSVPLNVVIVSNADEFASGGILSIDALQTVDQPSDFVSTVQIAYPGKQLKVQSIIIQPNDSACYNQQHINNSEFGWYGNIYNNLSNMTGGYVGTICASDYSGIMTNIASNIKTDDGSRALPCQPLNPPTITLSPSTVNSTWSVVTSGSTYTLEFTPALPAGTTVSVDLTCAN